MNVSMVLELVALLEIWWTLRSNLNFGRLELLGLWKQNVVFLVDVLM
jgi:hypothetical protein